MWPSRETIPFRATRPGGFDGLEPAAIEPTLTAVLQALERWMASPATRS